MAISRLHCSIGAFAGLLTISIVVSGLASAGAQESGTLTVLVVGLEHGRGQVGCSLFSSDEGWPSDREEALEGMWAPIREGSARCVFRNVRRGTYAVGVIHDEDGNGELNSTFVGRPLEGWGVSNDVPPRRFGAPRFDPASFEFDGTRKRLRVRLRY